MDGMEKGQEKMRFITNVFLVTGIMIGLPVLFYLIFHGTNLDRLPDIHEVDSGYVITREGEYDLDEYLLGVLPAQIDLESEYAAIKAQAVIARTSILRQMNGKKKINGDSLEETYISQKKLKEQIGEKEYTKKYQILTKAILETRGIAMQSEGEYILPLYHEVSIGSTISAKEMYGTEISYLKAADSSMDVESPDYMEVEEWEYEDAMHLIEKEYPQTSIHSSDLEEKIKILSKSSSGYVKKLKVADLSLTGEKWKQIFGLNSTNFYIEDYQHRMRIVTLGKGHGLGLSLYGANELAKQGMQYKKILEHYYHHIKFVKVYD